MKLLLTSAGLTNKSIIKALSDLVNKPFSELKVAFIPTAANVEEGDKGWLINDMSRWEDQGFAAIDIVDISALPRKIWQPRIEEADILLFGGGNTFYLMYWIIKSGLRDILPGLLKNKVYVGISAGSMIASKSLFLSSSDRSIFNKDRVEDQGDDGLGYVDFYIRPHFNSPHFPKARTEILEEVAKTVSEPIYALGDNSAVKIDGDNLEIISEGEWKKFN